MSGEIGPAYRLSCDFHAFGAFVELEAEILKEAVNEMIANAVAAMPYGGEIRLSTRLSDDEGPANRPEIVIECSDNGSGMDPVTLATARDPFFTTRAVGKDMGLGLSLLDGIARIAGGELRLSSELGSGTTVALHLPRLN